VSEFEANLRAIEKKGGIEISGDAGRLPPISKKP
jgi:hypothetical protein